MTPDAPGPSALPGALPRASRGGPPDAGCPLCASLDFAYLFVSGGVPMERCAGCGLTRSQVRQARSRILAFPPGGAGPHRHADGAAFDELPTEREASAEYLDELDRRGASRSPMLVVAPAGHPLADVASSRGYQVETAVTGPELGSTALAQAHYETAVVLFELSKTADPAAALARIHRALVEGGALLLVTLSLDSWPARFFGRQWHGWRPENLYHFDSQVVRSLLAQSGFVEAEVQRDRRRYTLEHVHRRAREYPRTSVTLAIELLYRVVPPPMRHLRVRMTSSAIVISARRGERRVRRLLSIVVPVYNERATFAAAMDAVLAKQLAGVDTEVIVVESNSTDGTRELVRAYDGHPQVTVMLEDRPRGKGHAVRAGLARARGDFVMIQDADLEYDVNDYDALVEPLATYRRAFVLGSRHAGDWKLRKFSRQIAVATLFNLGHWLFVGLLNALYRQRLRDPFTMYKVFRRDCLYGLTLECNRFDFDFELVIKLVRSGYAPLELPVNYDSREPSEGKKVSVLRDPPTWIWALIKYRFSPVRGHRAAG